MTYLQRIIYFILIKILLTISVYSENVTEFNNDSVQTAFKNIFFKFSPPVVLSSLKNSNISAKCRSDSEIYMRDLQNLKLWALKMYDATGKFPSGLLNGNVHVSGDLDSCFTINEHSASNQINGKFCVASIFAEPTTQNKEIKDAMELVHSYYAVNSNFDDDVNFFPTFSKMSWGFCIPSSCRSKDLEKFLHEFLKPYNHTSGLEIKLRVESHHCSVKEDATFSPALSQSVFLIICVIWIILSVVGGLYDFIYNHEYYNLNNESLPVQILYAFSLRRNWQLFLNLDNLDDDIECVHGIRTLFSINIYLVHRAVFGLFKPMSNRTRITELMEGPASMLFRAFLNHVDTFVLLSGLLTSYYAVKKLQQGSRLNIMSMYIKRYIKFAPIYIILTAIIEVIFIFGSGPTMLRVVRHFIISCNSNFWKSFLFIGNLDGIDRMCYPPAHQLVTDFQMYLAAPFIILFLWKNLRHAGKILAGAIVLLSLIKGATIFYNEFMMAINFGASLKKLVEASNTMYLNPIYRAPPYLFGIGLGFYMRVWKKTPLSYDRRNIGWCMALASAYYAFFAQSNASLRDYKYDRVQETIYGVFQAITWSFALCWVIFMCHCGYGGVLNRFLSWKGFRLFSKISYPFYMSQIIIIFAGIAGVYVPVYTRATDLIDLNEIVFILGVSMFLTIVYMYPVGHLYSIFSNYGKKKSSKSHKTENSTKSKIVLNEYSIEEIQNSIFEKSKMF